MREPMIILEGVSKSYPFYQPLTGGIKNLLLHLSSSVRRMKNSRFEALKDISFEVKKGEALGIIGRNGAGKSTLLGLIAGVLKPDKGKIIVNGKVCPLLELGAGFHPELTGRENIILNGILMGLKRKEILKKMDDIIEFSELNEFIDQPLRTYSSGMLARLGFSVISSLEPEILLIDEILAVGDINFQKKCLERIVSFKRSSVTIVFVSHSLEQIEFLCDKVIWIDEHRTRMEGEPQVVIKAYRESMGP